MNQQYRAEPADAASPMSADTGREATFYAHSDNHAGVWQPMADHLMCVGAMARCFASSFAAEEAELAGLLHDLGKYGDKFQRRLHNLEAGLDHWSAGAWVALRKFHAIAAAAAIQGHHIGLQQLDIDALRGLDPVKLTAAHPLGLRLAEPDTALLQRRLAVDGLRLPEDPALHYGRTLQQTVAAMLDVRMLFSALVDADFLDTEAHSQSCHPEPRYRPAGVSLDPGRALSILTKHVSALTQESACADTVKKLRADLWHACIEGGRGPGGLATLSAPTGAGKTLAMVGWALRHASEHQLRRIVVVIPYLSIIEQTAQIYRGIFCPHLGDNYILEHHSMAGTGAEPARGGGAGSDAEGPGYQQARLLAENWDAPLIVTTSVQFLESLFSNRPSACRKLHRLAESVVLFDEVQTLPLPLALPTLAALAHLASRYRASVVFSTATQPAFSHLDGSLRTLHQSGWQPREIVPPRLNLFARARRTELRWPETDRPIPWRDLIDQLAAEEQRQSLCVVNLKRHAHHVASELSEQGLPGVYHLSTSMCPAHRQEVLSEVRTRLQEGKPCRLITTQCVEAGVDVDFPVVYRAFGPLEAVAQAAGRCNRNGNRPTGRVTIFLPEEECYPSKAYKQAAAVTRVLLKERGAFGMDINSPDLFEDYYCRLYDIAHPEVMRPELMDAIRCQDFAEVAREYRIVDEDSINILVPYDQQRFQQLADEVRLSGLRAHWMRRAQPHVVGLYRPGQSDAVRNYLEAVPIAGGEMSGDWFIYLDADHYHRRPERPDLGLLPPQAPPTWVI